MPERPFIRSEWVVVKRTPKGQPSQYQNKVTNEIVSERTFRHLKGQRIKGEKGKVLKGESGYQKYIVEKKKNRELEKKKPGKSSGGTKNPGKKRPGKPYYKERKADGDFGMGTVWIFYYDTPSGKYTLDRFNKQNARIDRLVHSFPNGWKIQFHIKANVYGGISDNPADWPFRTAPVGAGAIEAGMLKQQLDVFGYANIYEWISEGNDIHIRPVSDTNMGVAEIHVIAWKPELMGQDSRSRSYIKPTVEHKNKKKGKKVKK